MTTRNIPSPDDLSSSERIGGLKPVGEDKLGTPVQSFQSFMQEPGKAGPAPGAPARTAQLSPFDLAHGTATPPTTPTIATLSAQATTAQSGLGDIVSQLNTPNLKLKQSSKYILKNKLADASAHARAANAKIGGPEVPPVLPQPGSGPIQKLIAYATDGQNNLQAAQKILQDLHSKGESLNPGDLLQIQIKLNQAQLEIQYSSVLLSTAVEDMKTLFNITL